MKHKCDEYRGNITDASPRNLTLIGSVANAAASPLAITGGIKLDTTSAIKKFYITIIKITPSFEAIGSVYAGDFTEDTGTKVLDELFSGNSFLQLPTNLAIDPNNGEIYIANQTLSGENTIYKGNLDGNAGSLEVFVPTGNLETASDLEIDIENQFLLWMDTDSMGNSAIKRVRLDKASDIPENIFSGFSQGLYFDIEIGSIVIPK